MRKNRHFHYEKAEEWIKKAEKSYENAHEEGLMISYTAATIAQVHATLAIEDGTH